MAIVATTMLSLCLIGCHSRPQEQGYQLTDQEKRQIEQGFKKTNEQMKTLTTGYGKEMQHVAPNYPTQPISRQKTTPPSQQAQQQAPSKSVQP
jgi:uncharacterized membrane-anchored protein YhcB (DUF1043 family)